MKIRVWCIVFILFLFTVFVDAGTKSETKATAKKHKVIKIGHLRFEGGDGSSMEKVLPLNQNGLRRCIAAGKKVIRLFL